LASLGSWVGLAVRSVVSGGESFDWGDWSYSNFLQQRLEEDVVVDACLDDFWVVGHVDQHGKGILGDGRVVFDQELEIADRFESVAFEQTGLSCAETDQVLGGWYRALVFDFFG
jgi:hypothetical protein